MHLLDTLRLTLPTLMLGPPGRARVRILMTLLTAVIYLLFAGVALVLVRLGQMEAQATGGLLAFCLLGSLGFYGLVRSGLSERLSSEPSLMIWQNTHSVVAVVWAYALLGPLRGAVLTILVLIVAYGMFALSARQARWLGLFALTSLALVMAAKSASDPALYPWRQEVVHLMITGIVLLGMSALSIRMGALRRHLRQQRVELEVSLERIRQLATRDELTGLVNRRHMTELLTAEQARQLRTGRAMTLAMLDLDHFKHVNDSHGHLAGDAVLRVFAASVEPCLRSSDVLARWGGEEFLLMLPETGQAEAQQCVERMRASLAGVAFGEIATGLEVTFSAGLAPGQPGDGMDEVIELADRALYGAKQAGRNCTVSGWSVGGPAAYHPAHGNQVA
jgi:diguanylate cyclase (GGDEF)-like protein